MRQQNHSTTSPQNSQSHTNWVRLILRSCEKQVAFFDRKLDHIIPVAFGEKTEASE